MLPKAPDAGQLGILKRPSNAVSVMHVSLSLLLATNLLSNPLRIRLHLIVQVLLSSWPAPFSALSSLDGDRNHHLCCLRASVSTDDLMKSHILEPRELPE